MLCRSFGFAFLFLAWMLAANSSMAQSDLIGLLDESTIAVVELTASKQWIQHPMRQTVVRSDAFKQIWKSPNVMKIRGAITIAEFSLGDKLENLIEKLLAQGAVAAYDKDHMGWVVLARANDKTWLRDYADRFVKVARDDAQKNGRKDPIQNSSYRDVQTFEVSDGVVGVIDDLIIASNKKALAKEIADRYIDRQEGDLKKHPKFQAAWEEHQRQRQLPEPPLAWLYTDVAALRDAGVNKEVFGGKAKDFGAELIIGGLLATLHQTPYATANLALTGESASLVFSAPHQAGWGGESRNFFFGPDGKGAAEPLLRPENMLASVSAYRDVSQLWLRAGDLFDQAVNDQLAQADNTLTTLFSGRDFGEDILGAMQPQVRLVACLPTFAENAPAPAIRLPSFALVAQLRDPKVMRPELKRTFQSLIGFLNIVGAMNGQPQLDLEMQSEGDRQFYFATYVRDVDRKENAEAPIQFNFSPCIAFAGDNAIVASTKELANVLTRTLDEKTASTSESSKERTLNSLIEVDGAALKTILQANQRQLVAQNMLQKGHSKEEAESEIGTLLKVLDLLKRGTISLAFESEAKIAVTLELQK